ncbi:MAG: hypothetical protein NTV05_18555 [Acidobacteria bacterium]|nr:hypothetical protein [Acidobacteriota bacterium]
MPPQIEDACAQVATEHDEPNLKLVQTSFSVVPNVNAVRSEFGSTGDRFERRAELVREQLMIADRTDRLRGTDESVKP